MNLIGLTAAAKIYKVAAPLDYLLLPCGVYYGRGDDEPLAGAVFIKRFYSLKTRIASLINICNVVKIHPRTMEHDRS